MNTSCAVQNAMTKRAAAGFRKDTAYAFLSIRMRDIISQNLTSSLDKQDNSNSSKEAKCSKIKKLSVGIYSLLTDHRKEGIGQPPTG